MPKVFLKTYGCQMNVRDSEQVSQQFIQRGFTLTENAEEADVVLINTCSVRDMAEQKALGRMGGLSHTARRRGRPATVYGFLGCMAQSRGAELLESAPGVNLVVGTQKFQHVVDHVEALMARHTERQMDDERYSIVDVEEEEDSQNSIREHVLKPQQATAFVSIMQGCNMKCAFCIVPYTRGAERSRPIPEIVQEVRGLVEQGVKEVTLLGQIVNQYGRREFPIIEGKGPFVQLLEAVHEIPGLERLRFTSPHPVGFREDLVRAFAELPKLMPHAHFPLQSGSNRILKKMKRSYSRERYLELIEAMRSARPDLAFTTDIIVGFPGETDEDYLETRELVQQVKFENAFIFKYSQRRGTPAADMPDQLDETVKEARNQDLLDVVDDLSRKVSERMVGRQVEVLCEGPSKNNPTRLTGRTPTNRVVIFEGAPRLQGNIFPVHISETTGHTLYGSPAIHA